MIKAAWKIVRQAFREWLADGAFQLAAALSFYTVISLAPLVTLSLSAASFFYGEQALRGELVERIGHLVGEHGAEVIENILANARRGRPGLFGAVGVLMLFLGASAVFLQLQKALNTVWNVAPRTDRPWRHTLKVRLLSMGLVLGVGFLLLASTLVGAALELVTGKTPEAAALWQPINFVFGAAVAAAVFAALFKILPDAVIRWRDAWVGAAVTTILFEAGRLGIAFYLGKSAPASAYGASGSLVALLLWIYYSALILLLGAEFAQVYARCCGERIRPSAHAYRTSVVAVPVDDEGRPILTSNPDKEDGNPESNASLAGGGRVEASNRRPGKIP